ncbi:dihydropteroate synthase [bacterium SCSIO 12741]|nr:dihydropteroate synthase [bacterium SCSIO 12741]
MNHLPEKRNTIRFGGKLYSLDRTYVMGILNLTPDSFFDGGKLAQSGSEDENGHNHSRSSLDEGLVIDRVEQMVNDGADFIDVGAVSTRPGAKAISVKEEIHRLRFLGDLVKRFPQVLFSIDTYRSEVVRFAADQGVVLVNDVSAGQLDTALFSTVGELGLPYVLMHMQGKPDSMQNNPTYDDVVGEVTYFFSEKIQELRLLGVSDIILDPGFGFGKTVEHNYTLLREMGHFQVFSLPMLAGVSRKSMINKVLKTKPEEALNGTTVLHTLALKNGAGFLRVHDVKEAVQTIRLLEAYRGDFANIAG